MRLRTFILIYNDDDGMFDLTHHHVVLEAIQSEHERRAKKPSSALPLPSVVAFAIVVTGVGFLALLIARALRSNAKRSSDSRLGGDRC